MDLRSLQTFIQVAEMNSFTRAAEKLGYSQPTISFQIKQLEGELGVQLFERIGHTVKLTAPGSIALEYAQKICRMSEEMAQGADERRIASGTIRLAMADSLCAPLVIRDFAGFRAAYPNISLHITTAGTDELFRMLDHNEADMVCTLDSRIYNTNYITASEEKIGVHFVAAASHPIASQKRILLDELVKESFLLTEKGMSYRRLMDEMLAKHDLEIQPALEFGRADLVCRLVEEGAGLSFLPDYVTEDAVHRGSLVRLDVMDMQAELWKQLLYHRGKWISQPLRAVIDYISGVRLSFGK